MENNEINYKDEETSEERKIKFFGLIFLIVAVILIAVILGVLLQKQTSENEKSNHNITIFATDEISFNMGECIEKPNMKFDSDLNCEYCYGRSTDGLTCLVNITDEYQNTNTCGVCEEHAQQCFYCNGPTKYITSNYLLMPLFICEDCYNSIIDEQNIDNSY